ncbi:cell envelope integrity TolA C-terminal domain-containing protein [bacterium endosymbiont of Pedicinus badii]|uniref:cell envelope integrity TolA C-terminal domain-containing protein n=1 Tax=bacterium endosymbiont of Pedicinus badii TaxID=1719126 RepID=UPI0009BC1991|nr:cell envelope integrity TolA C-terminal domain-containing protein [bacterium endosymbiont of Pedicinus badii]OQM34324.1 hypothetical protein AOQ89_00295 [bacterium endosymbiont of Pedicinus badii]
MNSTLRKESEIYKKKLYNSIKKNFYVYKKHLGKTCIVKIRISKNGKIFIVQFEPKKSSLCVSALQSIKSANIPIPNNEEIYKIFENTTIEFSPK